MLGLPGARVIKCLAMMIGFIIGLTMVVFGTMMIVIGEKIINDQIEENISLLPGSETFKSWIKPPVPVYSQYWIFNVTNPTEILKGAKPSVKEIGPYTYRKLPKKTVFEFQDSQTKVHYTETNIYQFVPEMSVGHENDTFTGINVLALSLAGQLNSLNSFYKLFLKSFYDSNYEMNLFRSDYTVGGYLWGQPLEILISLKTAPFIGQVLNSYNLPDHFGLMRGMIHEDDVENITSQGDEYVIYTGKDDASKVGQIVSVNGAESLTNWNSSTCNMINGSDGSRWHPRLQKNEKLQIFSSNLCRSISLTQEALVEIKGIPTYKYTLPKEVFASAKENPENEGFCVPECLESGVIAVASCTDGSPMIISQPHFYQGSPTYINAVDGMNPSEDHQLFLHVEPLTGMTFEASMKLQLNVKLESHDIFSDTELVQETVFPVVWFNYSAGLEDATADEFKVKLLKPVSIMNILKYVLLGGGFLLLLISVLGALYCDIPCRRRKDDGEEDSDIQCGVIPDVDATLPVLRDLTLKIPLATECVISSTQSSKELQSLLTPTDLALVHESV